MYKETTKSLKFPAIKRVPERVQGVSHFSNIKFHS